MYLLIIFQRPKLKGSLFFYPITTKKLLSYHWSFLINMHLAVKLTTSGNNILKLNMYYI